MSSNIEMKEEKITGSEAVSEETQDNGLKKQKKRVPVGGIIFGVLVAAAVTVTTLLLTMVKAVTVRAISPFTVI